MSMFANALLERWRFRRAERRTRCGRCNGTGTERIDVSYFSGLPGGGDYTFYEPCPDCGGTGVVKPWPGFCQACGASDEDE